MRVVTGLAKGKPILTTNDITIRPTTGKVKEAMFSILQFEIENSVVLDLFSGTGQLGIEALSRGAKSCTFVDNSFAAHEVEMKNLKKTKLEKKAKVILSDSLHFLKNTNNKYNIIFMDPPYNSDILIKSLELAQNKLENSGFIVCEHDRKFKLPEYFKNISLQKKYDYGRIEVTVYVNKL